jgi:hypothetical protein
MEQGGDDGRGKRKLLTKQFSRQGRGRGAGSSGAAPRASVDRVAHEQYIAEEERNQRIRHTILARPDTLNHLSEFNDSYMKDNDDEFILKAPQDNIRHPIVDYAKSWKGTCEAREIDPYATDKLLGIDYRFWSVFHSNFYATAILTKPRGKISKIKFIDFNELQERNEFATAIKTYDRFQLTDIMSFRYDWNREILAQFHAIFLE